MEMILFLLIGIALDRYIFPIFDMLLELISQYAARKSTSIQIDTNLMSLDYQEIAEQGGSSTSAIGFVTDKQDDDEYMDDDDDIEEENKNLMKIGFVK